MKGASETADKAIEICLNSTENIRFTPYNPLRSQYHRLTLLAGTGGSIELAVSGHYRNGKSIAIKAVCVDGYYFGGWSAPAGEIKDAMLEKTEFIMPNRDVTLTATFIENPPKPLIVDEQCVVVSYTGGALDLQQKYEELYPEQSKTVNLTAIAADAFTYNGRPSSVTIPGTITSIPDGTFRNCYSLSSITVTGGGSYQSVDGVLFDLDITRLICYPRGKMGASYEVPASVTHIASFAFYGVSQLTEISFASASALTEIGAYAFHECDNLTVVNIPRSVVGIGGNAFTNCRSLTAIYVEEGNSQYANQIVDGVSDGVLYRANKTVL